jgi:hypothetical protein
VSFQRFSVKRELGRNRLECNRRAALSNSEARQFEDNAQAKSQQQPKARQQPQEEQPRLQGPKVKTQSKQKTDWDLASNAGVA